VKPEEHGKNLQEEMETSEVSLSPLVRKKSSKKLKTKWFSESWWKSCWM